MDASGTIYFSQAYTATLRPDCALEWSAESGWLLHPHLDVEPDEDGRYDHYAGARWLAEGLVPPPARVAALLLAGQLDWEGAGSADRPVYRRPGDGYEQLLVAMAGYLPSPVDPPDYSDWRRRFDERRDFAYFWRAVDELTPAEPDPLVEVPLRRSEARALLRLLELLEAHSIGSTSDLAAAAAAELTARLGGGWERAETHRVARDLALRAQGWRSKP